MAALGTLDQLPYLCLSMTVSGFAWICVLSSLQVTAQLALPDWVRSRGLAVFMMTFMGSMAMGSLMWGKIAEMSSIHNALLIAAFGAAVAVAFTWRWRISGVGDSDLSPSMRRLAPMVHEGVSDDRPGVGDGSVRSG
jgi:branched-subunit amino acid transport protein